MARRSEGRREELQHKYGNDAFTPIAPKYIGQARELSARYILFVNKDNKHGFCESCCNDVEFERTTHKQKMACPNCGKELTIQHTWRKSQCEWNVDWYVVGQSVDENTFALRYIEVRQGVDYTKQIDERAREIYDFKHGWSYQFSNLEDGWKVDSRYYFTEFTMNWHRRKHCCIGAKSLHNIGAELRNTISDMKYFNEFNTYFNKYIYPRDNVKCLLNASLYEKLEKVGLGKLAMEDYLDYHSTPIKYKRSETSLLKMLGVNKLQYNLLLKNATKKILNFIRANKDMPIQMLEYIVSYNKVSDFYHLKGTDDNHIAYKKLKYVMKNGINAWEYTHYLGLLKKLEYTIDESYMFPKDFRKADDRVSEEWNAILDAKKLESMSEQSGLIKQISDGLRKMPDIKEFLNGSEGLLVYVPESAKDLLDEGRKLHNCIGSYVDRIAEGKTLVFFVRRLDAPNDPFVAFEYVNGDVVQCRYDHNKNVDDDKIINFVDAFAERLRRNKVLCNVA